MLDSDVLNPPILEDPHLPALIEEFATTPRLDAFGGVHAPGNDYADVEIATMNCVIATQDFHDFLLEHEVLSTYVSSDAPEHVANLLGDTVIDWTLRQFDPSAQVPTVESLEVYRLRFNTLSLLSEDHANVYSKDENWPYWWNTARRVAFAQQHPALSPSISWPVQSIAPDDVRSIEQEWLASHPDSFITRGPARTAMGSALALASSTGHLLAARAPDGGLAGLLTYLQDNPYPNGLGAFHLAWLGVEPSFQRQGAGAALLASLAELAFQASKPITTSPATPLAKGFFLSHGFRYLGWGRTWSGAYEPHYILPFRAVRALVARSRDPLSHFSLPSSFIS